MDRWTELELLAKTAELGSLSRAAEALGMSNPAATRYLSSLEDRLGVRLVERSTRRLYFTEIGREYVERTKAILQDAKESDSAAQASNVKPTGTLRITASLSFSILHIAPLIPEYTRLYPDVSVHVETANRYLDIIDNSIDLAVRTREYENDSSITIRRLAETRRILTASPEYLRLNGAPECPEQLLEHKILNYTLSKNYRELKFTRCDETSTVAVDGLMESNDGQVLRTAALSGLGILVQPKYIVYDDVKAGRLIPVLDQWDLPRLTINLAYPSRKHLSAKVRTFIDLLTGTFREKDYERLWTN
ncbi:LysR family transcriptional regulator [Paraburkholderia phytofirmans]|jgi:DNA-binding transcriptional LysR family regulator|uniref:LysR family transcriptional regulator n=1 Tax=Paraburkholderia sp. BL9I2N2 TaxID=1938809 RepID=UPI0010484351|nr:LysR family transcriptional regulator [Paraburkholderia sp. BL9I2N2]TCK88653.1 DNA-binding transcriptional LysR family regulator [Paraburkholderia sp. BL9I2N2]